jgi:sugar-specific transcriptional regulator TrmB
LCSVNTEIFRKIGLTEGEIRVYEAVVTLGKSSTGPIMQQCGISSSKVYLILEKLIKKGFVTFTIENNVKRFHAANPINIIEYLDKQERELEKTKQEAQVLVKEVNQLLGSHEEEVAKIYKGRKSMLTAFQNILDELKNVEDFFFIGAPVLDLDALQLFFQNLHQKRIKQNIKTRGIADISTKKKYRKIFEGMPHVEIRFLSLNFPHAVGIGTKRVIISLWGPHPIAFEIESERMAQRYREFFLSLWKKSK